jgi:hypothetical protein
METKQSNGWAGCQKILQAASGGNGKGLRMRDVFKAAQFRRLAAGFALRRPQVIR